jgi:hypothetical protein
MREAMGTEVDPCRKYVLPKFCAAGWNDEQIREQVTFTDRQTVEIMAGIKTVLKEKP